MKRCRNELVARMDADDVSLPTRCEKELKMFEKYPELAVCGCNIDEFSGDFTKQIYRELYRVNMMILSNSLEEDNHSIIRL